VQLDHILQWVWHTDVTEALSRHLTQLCFAAVGELTPPCDAHAPQMQQVRYLLLG